MSTGAARVGGGCRHELLFRLKFRHCSGNDRGDSLADAEACRVLPVAAQGMTAVRRGKFRIFIGGRGSHSAAKNREHLLAIPQPTTEYEIPLSPILCPISIWGKSRRPMSPRPLPPGSPSPRNDRPNDRDLRRRRKLYSLPSPPRTGNCPANLTGIHPLRPLPTKPPKANWA
ncbi:uncharacterized protein ASPGLDRAFT_1056405 [Aspergillus glaucus CBS 516.65]|uniref:Uncharacterized protein n=1 Tax=Aspergillus glaucus CBS 516.65 TaxID=1160497 RepID=A0A1L9V5Y4_ASPGL|nr:hypothetical protein ASPGLDRAFT_1056405 [Aspergillus glaucus CBS 516.65]OJJ79316.1 hypothetical protein ASPGLDRAFT_1056405 [Aspergillus glaucus CBS 516.65]